MYSIKLPSAVQRASILDLKLMQAFTRVPLSRNPITSFIFWVRSLYLLQDFALTLYSETPHTKQSNGLQSGKLGSQTSSTHTSVRFSLSQSCILWLSWAGLLSCLGISSYLSTILRYNLLIFDLFILIKFSNFFLAS